MKFLIVGAPLSGLFRVSSQFESLLSLTELKDIKTQSALELALDDENNLPDNCVIAGHFDYDAQLQKKLVQNDFLVIVALRNPYTNLQALYQQAQTKVGVPSCQECSKIRDLKLDSPEMKTFTREHFSAHLSSLGEWLECPGRIVLNIEYFDKSIQDIATQLTERYRQYKAGKERTSKRLNPSSGSVNNWSHVEALRLPRALVSEVNRALPASYQNQGYQHRSEHLNDEINAVMLGFSDYLRELPKRRHVFIVGNGKSGTTWLHLAFFRHPNVVSLAERRLYEHPDRNVALFDQWLNPEQQNSWFESSSFGKRFSDHLQINDELQRVVSDYMAYRSLSMIVGEDGFNRATPISHITEKIALTSGEDANTVIHSLASTYPNATIIHIIRDPRDVAISTLFHIYRDQQKSGDTTAWIDNVINSKQEIESLEADSAFFKDFCDDQAKSWNAVVSAFHNNGEKLFGENYYPIKYEDMLTSPDDCLRQIFTHCKLNTEPQVLDQVVEKTSFQSITKGRNTGEQDSSSFYRKGVAGDWENYIERDKWQQWFEPCLEQMSLFGYE